MLRRLLARPLTSMLFGGLVVGTAAGAASVVLDTPYALSVGLAVGAPLFNLSQLAQTGRADAYFDAKRREGAAIDAALSVAGSLALALVALAVAERAGATDGLLVAVAAGAAVLGGNGVFLVRNRGVR